MSANIGQSSCSGGRFCPSGDGMIYVVEGDAAGATRQKYAKDIGSDSP